MAEKQNNTSDVDTNVFIRAALITDLNPSHISKEQYSHARNATRNSKDGDLGSISNESSTLECWSAPYKIIGTVQLPEDQVLVFSTDETNSEIGIGNISNCSYTKLTNLSCLNFSAEFPISGVAKKDFSKGVVVTFTDKNNGIRRIELKKLASVKNCDDILLFKKIAHPCITVKKGRVGNIPNGTYSVVAAYSVDNNVFSDWFSTTNRVQLHSESSSNSLEVKIEGLDTDFKEFTLGVVGNYIDPVTKGATKSFKVIGNYSTKIKSVSITDFINSTYKELPISTLVIGRPSWQKAGIITSNTNYLLIADLVGRQEENYQLKAMSIKAEYVIEQVPGDYYETDGSDVGYYGDENYDFYIQGVYNTGELTDKFHIPGRKAKAADKAAATTADAYEYDVQLQGCDVVDKLKKWQTQNTAGKLAAYNNEFSCGRRVWGRGEMGYFESTELYPDNAAMFGEDANTPIRYHKFPDECKVPRYTILNGKTYINIKGVRFKHIPKFDSPDIIGYKITRSDRKGGNGTVVARGLMTNVRFYEDSLAKQTIMYAAYNVNDLSADKYLSSTQTAFKNGKETNYTPLKTYYRDKFNFYSPHTLFEPRYSLGTEIKIESEEVAEVTGNFEKVYNHPQQKLMNQFAFWLSAAVGFIESSLILLGKNSSIATRTALNLALTHTGAIAGTTNTLPVGNSTNSIADEFNIRSVEDLIGLDLPRFIAKRVLAKDLSAFQLVKNILTAIASLGLKVPYSVMGGIRQADQTFDTIYNFTGYTDYVYQYNAHALFNKSVCVKEGNKRRRLLRDAIYLPSDITSIDDRIFNNHFREKSVYLELNKPISDPTTKDTSMNTISGFGVCEKPGETVKSVGSAFYATSKAPNPNQYGSLGSSAPVAIHSCPLTFDKGEFTESPILYGGDCIITRFQFQKRMQFFNQNIAGTNYPPGTEFDYRLYRNIAFPRFWMDSTKFDFSQLLSSNVMNFTKFSRTTSSKYNLDCKKKKDGKSIARIDDAYMYLANNSVMDFYVECDYNPNFREKTELPFYSKQSTNLSQIFRSDRWNIPEEFTISRVYSDIYTTEVFAQQQRDDFDPLNPIPVQQPNSVIYSLPSFNLQEVDNWQYFLPSNYFAFRESDFGTLTGVHKLDQDRVIFLFSKSSPYMSIGRDFLQLEQSGRKITVGDGGLFAQDPREMMPTDNNYGACNSRYAFSNTHLGRFFPSERQGRILESDKLDDITRQGMSYWCKNYMPIFLYQYFPSFPQVENPLAGVGYLMAFDSFNETIYISKRDFVPKRELVKDITYSSGQFFYRGRPIKLRDSAYFNDVSWTLSYSPIDKGFVSWHDWHPDAIVQTDNHFISIKDNKAWKHNERFDSYCNFYGKDYPFEIEFVSSSGQQVEIVRSLEYFLEVYKYKNFGRDRFHVLNENFDHLIVHNTEQISPLLKLTHASANPEDNLSFPRKNGSTAVTYDALFFKEENKYRVNHFWDSTKDRGEFSGSEIHLFPTDESGYKNIVNPSAIDIDKPEEQRKKFRSYWTKFRLSKAAPGPHKFIVKIANIKKLVSLR